MPEAPETALFAHDLQERFGGATLVDVEFTRRSREYPDTIPVENELHKLRGESLWFSSRGKLLFINRDIVVRLGMTGRFLSTVPGNHLGHIFCILHTSKGPIYYTDFRTFSRWSLRTPEMNRLLDLYMIGGWVPVTHGDNPGALMVNRNALLDLQHNLRKSVPAHIDLLLRHGQYTGIGNYMATEALGREGIHPLSDWDPANEGRLVNRLCEIFEESFRAGGNSFAGGYVRLNGELGNYSGQCLFYKNPKRTRETHRGRPIYY